MQKNLTEKNFIRNALIAIYILAVLGFSATARAQMEIKPIFIGYKPAVTQTFVGEVAMTPNQEFYLFVSETEVYKLTANIDLFDYNGQEVSIEAFKSKREFSTNASVPSLDPLPGQNQESVAVPVLVVIGISGVAN